MKRILTDNVGHGMKLNGKKAAVALMEYKQTPIRETGRTPAMMMLGRELRDLIQVKDTLDPGRYLIHETYQMKAERAYAAKYLKENDRWAEHTKQQTPLNVGAQYSARACAERTSANGQQLAQSIELTRQIARTKYAWTAQTA